MHLSDTTLRDSARRAARIAALGLLGKVRESRDRLDHVGDDEALHDFRVDVRRLRSWLRAFRDVFSDTLNPKHERRLRRVGKTTGASRDLEVHIAWVEKTRKGLRGPARAGASWLLARLRDEKAGSDVELRQAVEDDFDRTMTRLDHALVSYVARVDEVEVRFGRIVSELLREQAATLSRALGRVSSLGDRAEAHEARIAAKRVRYLLEAFEEALTDVRPIVEELSALQDRLGELHDAQLFGSELATEIAGLLADRAPAKRVRGGKRVDPVPGLTALARKLHRVEVAAFDAVQRKWLEDLAAPLFSAIAAIADAVDDIAREGREIERKYLLQRMPAGMPPALVAEIRQGYLPGDRLVERVRTVESADDVRFFRTVKVGVGIDRLEIEEETDKRVFDALWPLTRGMRIRKRRHRVADNGHTWEIDEFLDRKLLLAEIELDDPAEAPAIPKWLEHDVEREVTEDVAFQNRTLAR